MRFVGFSVKDAGPLGWQVYHGKELYDGDYSPGARVHAFEAVLSICRWRMLDRGRCNYPGNWLIWWEEGA